MKRNQKIRITEGQLKRMVTESVKRVLNEGVIVTQVQNIFFKDRNNIQHIAICRDYSKSPNNPCYLLAIDKKEILKIPANQTDFNSFCQKIAVDKINQLYPGATISGSKPEKYPPYY